MNYLDKLVNSLKKKPLSITKFNNILEKSDTFFDSVELETELLISNGLPLNISHDKVSIKTANTKISDQTFCIVDIETSAGNARDGQIIEIGAVKYKNGQIIEIYDSLVNTSDIPLKVQEITGITPTMTHNAPNLVEVLEEFKIFLEDDVFVAHAINFDYKFINDSFKKYDLGQLCNRRVCTIDLSERLIKSERYGLKYLKEKLNIDVPNHHRAYSDALSTQKILEVCFKNLPDSVVSTEDLITFSKDGTKIN